MRRVYYSFTLRLLFSQATLAGIVFAVSVLWFAKLVHVAMVWQSFTQVPVGQVPNYAVSVLTHSDMLTLFTMLLMATSVGIVLYKLRHVSVPSLRTEQVASL